MALSMNKKEFGQEQYIVSLDCFTLSPEWRIFMRFNIFKPSGLIQNQYPLNLFLAKNGHQQIDSVIFYILYVYCFFTAFFKLISVHVISTTYPFLFIFLTPQMPIYLCNMPVGKLPQKWPLPIFLVLPVFLVLLITQTEICNWLTTT